MFTHNFLTLSMSEFSVNDSFSLFDILLVTEIIIPTITLYVCAILTLGAYQFRRPFSLLTMVFILGAVMLTIIMLLSFPATSGYEMFMFADMVGTLLMYPLAFGFLLEWIQPKWLSGRRIVYCFVAPVVLTVLFFLSRLILPTLEPLLTWNIVLSNLNHVEVWIRMITFLVVIIEAIVFTHILFKSEKRHHLSVQQNFSFTEGTNLRWVRVIAWQLIAYSVCLIVRDLFDIEEMRFLVGFLLSSLAISACIFSMRQQELYFKPQDTEEEKLLKSEESATNRNAVNQKNLKEHLILLLEKDEVFRDPNLSIETMYKMLNTNRTYLSNFINQEMGLSFYQLINSYRIKKAAELLQNRKNDTIAIKDIAHIVGFKSISTFNTLFKEEYNELPSIWRRESAQPMKNLKT